MHIYTCFASRNAREGLYFKSNKLVGVHYFTPAPHLCVGRIPEIEKRAAPISWQMWGLSPLSGKIDGRRFSANVSGALFGAFLHIKVVAFSKLLRATRVAVSGNICNVINRKTYTVFAKLFWVTAENSKNGRFVVWIENFPGVSTRN